MEPLIKVRGLSFRYPGAEDFLLRDLSFEVFAGEIFLLAGETGSGKSTLLSVLCGLIPWASRGEFRGEVMVLGRRWPVSPKELFPRVSILFQNPAEHLIAETVFSEIAFGLENLGLGREEIEKRVREALQAVGLSGIEDRNLKTLSGGERQRVALAAALAPRPKILLLDEPLAQLDPRATAQIMDILRSLARKGMTIIMAEHQLRHVLKYCHRVLYLEGGRLKFLGPSKDFRPPERRFPSFPRAGRGKRLLSLEGLSFSHPDGPEIFRSLDLSFYQGERVALLGPNGSGKTTFLHLIAGLLKPSRGRVRLLLESQKDSLPIGLLLQDPDLMLIRESVFRELAFAPENLGLPSREVERRVRETAGRLSLTKYLPKPPFSLSRGERLRVALGSILTGSPKILLLDEPTTAQDTRHAASLLAALEADLLLFSTHDEELARSLATRIIRFTSQGVRDESR